MTQLKIDFLPGTRICVMCEMEINENWAKERQLEDSEAKNFVCSDCWNSCHWTTRRDIIEGTLNPIGLFRNATKTQKSQPLSLTV